MLDVATEVYASIRYGKRITKGSKDFVTFKQSAGRVNPTLWNGGQKEKPKKKKSK